MATAFLYNYRSAFIAYAFTPEEKKLRGGERSFQRFEQCIRLLTTNAPLAIKALEAKYLFDPEIQKSAADLAAETIRDYRDQVVQKITDEKIRNWILGKIDSVKLVVMFPDEVLNISKINKLYEDLAVTGTEPFIKLYAELVFHRSRVRRESNDSWIQVWSNLLGEDDTDVYDKEANIICKVFYRFSNR